MGLWLSVSFKHRITSLYCWPSPLPVWEWSEWIWPWTCCAPDFDGVWRSVNNSAGSDLCWCYFHFPRISFPATMWCCAVPGAGSLEAGSRPCLVVPVQSCLGRGVFPAAFWASRSSSPCSSVCSTRSPHGGKCGGVTSELHQMVLSVVKENNIWERITSTSLSPVPPVTQCLPRCLSYCPAMPAGQLGFDFSCFVDHITPFC